MYAKVYTQILDGSLAADTAVRHLFMDMLILADIDGVVDMTPEAISARTRTPLDVVTHGLAKLSTPDKRSRTPDEEGRRITLVAPNVRDWGWQIVNYRLYRSMQDDDVRRLQNKNNKRAERLRQAVSDGKQPSASSQQPSATVSDGQQRISSRQPIQRKRHSVADSATGQKAGTGQAGQSGQDSDHQALIAWFCDEYQRQIGQPYLVQGGKDGSAVKRLLSSLSVVEVQAAAGSMFADDWGRANASLAILASQINRWRQGAGGTGDGCAWQGRAPTPAEELEEVNAQRVAVGLPTVTSLAELSAAPTAAVQPEQPAAPVAPAAEGKPAADPTAPTVEEFKW